ncbi:sigma 54-interacting transcriptional regulator [Thioflexithrix psekupsensis]|uniref:Two-component system response regulator GlrR n=1 Tax=Thioflexithrix psekupsensis TaxID=1570016 RepID=A0A251XB31_9GAMM|nr:sigma 54-interacting transcriptional regulator [Thioflexithrix psekupsensis]OUD15569.1 two-component system response regulator GlrR [Thioflexithrix psekupsensis]
MNVPAKTILIVDDDEDLRRLLGLRLKSAGYQVVTAESGEQALAHLSITQPQLVITDLQMSGMDGLTFFRQLHQQRPALPVLILTAHGTIPSAVTALQEGVFCYLTKPFEPDELLEQVAKALLLNTEIPLASDSEQWRADIITRNSELLELLNEAKLAAASEANIFISGESGTGKELLAQAIHRASLRHEKPFIAVNCSAIPEHLFESELFGHVRGAFTGAIAHHQGLFQAAHGGTLFLDEIGDLPLPLQTKLLRVLQERQVRAVGATQTVDIDVRIISATHLNLEQRMQSGQFREDLYYRLKVVTFNLPPLSARREDIPLLAQHFLNQLAQRNHKVITGFSPEALELLVHANLPGNVRQLFNIIEQTVVLSVSPIIPAALVQKALQTKEPDLLSFNEARSRFERDYLVQLLKIAHGNVTQAARMAKRNRTDFYKLLNRHELDPSFFKE